MTTASLCNVVLPTINLPKYDGSFINWREFNNAFSAILHINTNLTDAQKLSYLKSNVKGEFANLLKSFETTNNKRRIINMHVQKF